MKCSDKNINEPRMDKKFVQSESHDLLECIQNFVE